MAAVWVKVWAVAQGPAEDTACREGRQPPHARAVIAEVADRSPSDLKALTLSGQAEFQLEVQMQAPLLKLPQNGASTASFTAVFRRIEYYWVVKVVCRDD